MTTVLQYLVIAAVIGLVVFGLVVFVFGRGEQLAPLSPRTSPTELPDQGIAAQDVRKIRFAMALRGYRMSDVDWALDKMADEIDRLRTEVDSLSGATAADEITDNEITDNEITDNENSDVALAGLPLSGGRHQDADAPTTDTSSQRDHL